MMSDQMKEIRKQNKVKVTEAEWLPEAKPLLNVEILRYEAAFDTQTLDAIAVSLSWMKLVTKG